MDNAHSHPAHPEIVNRLKRTEGHTRSIIEMIESHRPCLEIAQQLHAVEKAVGAAKKLLIHSHIDHCLEHAVNHVHETAHDPIQEFKKITKYL